MYEYKIDDFTYRVLQSGGTVTRQYGTGGIVNTVVMKNGQPLVWNGINGRDGFVRLMERTYPLLKRNHNKKPYPFKPYMRVPNNFDY